MNPAPASHPLAGGLLLAAAAALPASLLWDYAWDSTVGLDRVWAPPHVLTYASMALAAAAALALRGQGVRLIRLALPLGGWLVLWGAGAYLTGFLFDRWWQASYGLIAGIWHPPQMLKAVAFCVVALGVWCVRAGAAGLVLALAGVLTLAENFPNRQHTALFYQVACAIYPLVLAAACVAGKGRFSATRAALVYTALHGAAVWLLPLVPGTPEVAPIYHPRTTLLPPPFPLLLVAPALAMDLLLRVFPSASAARRAVEGGLAFFVVFLAVQWPFASFLLSPAAEGWFFAGGGQHWPFFLKISDEARTAFWTQPHETFTLGRATLAALLAIIATRLGIALGARLKRQHA
jgi:hypothetical protein